MKPIKLLALGAILVMTATSCDTYKHSYRLTDVPTTNIAVTNQVVDVKADFDNKVNALDNIWTHELVGTLVSTLKDRKPVLVSVLK